MHDTDRILAELEALDEAEQGGSIPGGREGDLENFENLADFEFQPEGDFESSQRGMLYEGPQYEGQQYEAAQYEGAQYEGPQYENPQCEGSQYEGPQYEGSQYEGPQYEGPQYEGPQYESGHTYESARFGAPQFEAPQFEGSEFEAPSFDHEDEFEAEAAFGPQSESTFGELEEMRLAAELLEVQNEAELDHFFGGLIGKALGTIGKALAGPVGNKLVGLLKDAAKKVVPIAGSAIGGLIGGPAGAMLGGDIASTAGQLLGLELEGLAREDQEFETAKAFVRFATDAVQEAANAPRHADPSMVVRIAFHNAARRHAPGLLATASPGPAMGPPYHHRHQGGRMSGRWVRVARNQIMLYGL